MTGTFQTIAQDLLLIHRESFKSHGRALLYSGGFQFEDDTFLFNNWVEAERRADSKKKVPIQHTEGGRKLDNPDRRPLYGRHLVFLLWKAASQKYVREIEGDVQTLVCCSNFYSTFRTVELPELLVNKKVDSINGKPRAYYVAFQDRLYDRLVDRYGVAPKEAERIAADRVYKRVAMEEIRADREDAQRTGDAGLLSFAYNRAAKMKGFMLSEERKRQDPDFMNERQEEDAALAQALNENPELKETIEAVVAELPRVPSNRNVAPAVVAKNAAFKK